MIFKKLCRKKEEKSQHCYVVIFIFIYRSTSCDFLKILRKDTQNLQRNSKLVFTNTKHLVVFSECL